MIVFIIIVSVFAYVFLAGLCARLLTRLKIPNTGDAAYKAAMRGVCGMLMPLTLLAIIYVAGSGGFKKKPTEQY